MKLIGISLVSGLVLLVAYYFMTLPDPVDAEKDRLIRILNLKICLPLCNPFEVESYNARLDSCVCNMSRATKRFEYEQESYHNEPSALSRFPRVI